MSPWHVAILSNMSDAKINSETQRTVQNAKWLIHLKYGVLCILFVYLISVTGAILKTI